MADDKVLTPAQALHYLCVELKKRQETYAEGLKELHKKEQLKVGKLSKMQIDVKGPPTSPSSPSPLPPTSAPSGGGKLMLPGELAKDGSENIQRTKIEMAEKKMAKEDADDGLEMSERLGKEETPPGNGAPSTKQVKAGQPQGQSQIKKLPMKKDELAKAAIPPPVPGSRKIKLPGVNEAGLKAKVSASKPPAMPGMLQSSGPSVHLAGVGQPSAKPAQGVQTMTERVASKMSSPAISAPPKTALPGMKKPGAMPPPIPAAAKPAQPKVGK